MRHSKLYVHISAITALVGLSVLVSAAASASTTAAAEKQKLEITIRPTTETFQLGLSSAETTVRDSGTITWQTAGQRILKRGGQRVRVWTGVGRFSGKRGELALRFRWEWLDAGREYEAGIGTWSVVRGTELYAALRGNGRSAAVWVPGGPIASRVDGFVTR